jgi:two-component system OmpR family response regulator
MRTGERRKLRIVLIDDSPLILEMLSGALEAAGFETSVARDLSELEQRLATTPPDLVLIDVQMPEAFGDDVAMVLRAVRGLSAPIYLLSSLEEQELARRAAACEIEGYISKAIGVDRIVLRVQSILGDEA